ncbi:hypothetical protein BH20BAC1_BH20BAC1_05370 [soil metagenome]
MHDLIHLQGTGYLLLEKYIGREFNPANKKRNCIGATTVQQSED